MGARAIVVAPGAGRRIGNVEFLARTADTRRITCGIIDFAPGRALEADVHDDEDDAFYILEGELTFVVSGETVPPLPAPSCSCHRASSTAFATTAPTRCAC